MEERRLNSTWEVDPTGVICVLPKSVIYIPRSQSLLWNIAFFVIADRRFISSVHLPMLHVIEDINIMFLLDFDCC